MKSRWLPLCFLALLATPLVIDTLRLLHKPWRVAWKHAAIPYLSWQTVRDGKLGPALEEAWKEGSVVTRVTGARYNELSFGLLGRVPHEMVVGRDHSLFLRNQTTELGEREAAARVRRATTRITDFAGTLKGLNIELNVLIVPTRSRTYPELAYESGQAPPRLDDFLPRVETSLRQAGVRVISIAAPFASARDTVPVFYRDDHHWTYQGGELAAGVAASAMQESPRAQLVSQPKRELCWAADRQHRGSLVHKLKFSEGGTLERRFRDPQPKPQCLPPFRGAPHEPARVWVLTTSYGLWGFPQFLSLALGEPVSGFIGAGKGFHFSANQFIAQAANDPKVRLPEVVVWEIPEYHLYREDMLEGFRLPPVNRTKGVPVAFSLEGTLDARRRLDGSLRMGGTTGEATLTLDRPAKRVRVLVESSAMPARGALRITAGSVDIPYMLLDGRGPVGYDIEMPEGEKRLALHFTATRPGATLRVHEVRSLDGS